MSTILRFTHDATDTNFDQNEVQKVVLSNVQNSNVWQDVDEYYHLDRVGASYKKITISFWLDTPTTWTKLETLWGYKDAYFQPDTIKLYYEYLISTTNNYYVKMKRDNFSLQFFEGRYVVGKNLTLTFYEAVPSGVAVQANPIGI